MQHSAGLKLMVFFATKTNKDFLCIFIFILILMMNIIASAVFIPWLHYSVYEIADLCIYNRGWKLTPSRGGNLCNWISF